jgi:hypothetical protein
MRRGFKDVLMSAAALAIVLGALVAFDERLRDQFVQQARAVDVASTTTRLGSVSSEVVRAAQDRTLEHAAFSLFVGAAVVLVIFMLRT